MAGPSWGRAALPARPAPLSPMCIQPVPGATHFSFLPGNAGSAALTLTPCSSRPGGLSLPDGTETVAKTSFPGAMRQVDIEAGCVPIIITCGFMFPIIFYSRSASQIPHYYLYFIDVLTRASFGRWEGVGRTEGRKPILNESRGSAGSCQVVRYYLVEFLCPPYEVGWREIILQ